MEEELHSEILYETLHFAGCDAAHDRPRLLNYLKKAFKLDDAKYRELLRNAKAKKAPNLYLDVGVIEATVSKPTDMNGLSDPFCILRLASKDTQIYTTSIKPETLNPVWDENFVLPVENPSQDTLYIELWDFNPEETVQEKMMRIKEVKGVRGLKLFLKDVAVSASTGRHNNELIGSALIPLKNIPASGQEESCVLDKNGKVKKPGKLKLHLKFHFQKDAQSAFQEHRHLVYNLLLYQVENLKIETYKWTAEFSDTADTILTQHCVQCGLSSNSVTLAHWIEFINVHALHPLNFSNFLPLLQKLVKPLQDSLLTDEEKELFWESVIKLLPSCIEVLRKLQIFSSSDKTAKQPLDVCRILAQLAVLQPPKHIILCPMPANVKSATGNNENNYNISSAVRENIKEGALEWFSQVVEGSNVNETADDEEKIKYLINVMKTVITSLRKTLQCYEELFKECFHFSCGEMLYRVYAYEISEFVGPVVVRVCKSMKPLQFEDNTETGIYDNDPQSVGSTLFELYRSLQEFTQLMSKMCMGCLDLPLSNNFHHWFHPGLIQWLYISQYKALHMIQKAVNLDNLTPIHDEVEITSSADDTLHIFNRIKEFWKDLAWPDMDTRYTLVTKLIHNICECLVFYADKMCTKAQELCESNKQFQITKEWCLAIKSIRHIQLAVSSIVNVFELEDIISGVTKVRSSLTVEDCRESVQAVIANGIETSNERITNMLEEATQRMMPSISKLFMSEVECLACGTRSTDQSMKYLDDNLYMLHLNLDSNNFNIMFNNICKNLASTLKSEVENCMKMRKQPVFFKKFHETVGKVTDFFKQINTNIDLSSFAGVKQLLKFNEMTTWQLIHQYRIEQLSEQKAMQEAKYGLLTVKIQFIEDYLKIEVLNARNLQPVCPTGNCNPYVKICLLPEGNFLGVHQPKTKTQSKTAFPLFDEMFTIQLTSKQRDVENAMVIFYVKDEYLLGTNKFLGETLLSFEDIPKYDMKKKFENLEQIHLKLNCPTNLDSDVCKVLKERQDKLAKDFIKNRKAMFPLSKQAGIMMGFYTL